MSSPFSTLDSVLQDAEALGVFKQWIVLDPLRTIDAVDLYFAIKGFKEMLQRGDSSAANVASQVHRRFISLRTGKCTFLPVEIRKEMSQRIHALSHSSLNPNIFDPVISPLKNVLHTWYSHFACSEPFHKLVALRCSEGQETGYTELVFPDANFNTLALPGKKSSRKPSYLSGPSTSKNADGLHIPSFSAKYEKNFKNADLCIRHEKPDEREHFAALLIEELQKIARQLTNAGDDVYARDLPKSTGRDKTKTFVIDDQSLTISDEEVDKYIGKIDSQRERSSSEEGTSVHVSGATNPYGENGFAPPPYDFNVKIPSFLSNRKRNTNFPDSSGFCSSESAYFSDPSYGNHRSALNHSLHSTPPCNPAHYSAQTLRRPNNLLSSKGHAAPFSHFATLPRYSVDTPKVKCTLWKEGEQAPYVANVENRCMTLSEFRRLFGISRRENSRLLFKSTCDDATAPYQWSLISDDSTILPVFEGKITAESRKYVDSD
ncbi:unnamed protein product [Auanema sp. JU1783]|nr:unnamed protein product [Auanema sp. JU1783]